MITSGLVITLSADAALAAQAVAALSARSEFTPGERNDRWLPVAMEARDDAESRELHDWFYALPGVDYVDVVYVNFDEDEFSPVAADVSRLSYPPTAVNESQSLLTSAATNKRGEA
jgi:hypothetical protein